jgi:hypothetical protein
MLHLHDLLEIAAALAVILAMLRYGNIVHTRSPLWRVLTAPAWVGKKMHLRELVRPLR